MRLTSSSLLPRDIAASRSISCTLENFANFAIQPSRSSDAIASFSPWTSWTTRPPWRSIEGISISVEHEGREGYGKLFSNGDVPLRQELLEFGNAFLVEVKD